MRTAALPAVLCALILSGCAHTNTFFKTFAPQKSAMVDGKQRGVLVFPQRAGEPAITCAEPSPDALSTFVSEASASGNFEDKVALSGLLKSSEQGTKLGIRTSSIQILRDALYRLCEAYANGAIDKPQYFELSGGYQRQMAALMAIEQLIDAAKAYPDPESDKFDDSKLDALLAQQKNYIDEKKSVDEDIRKLQAQAKENQGDNAAIKSQLSLLESRSSTLSSAIGFYEKTIVASTSKPQESSKVFTKYQYLDSVAGYQSGNFQKASNIVGQMVMKISGQDYSFINDCIYALKSGYSKELDAFCTTVLQQEKIRNAQNHGANVDERRQLAGGEHSSSSASTNSPH